MENQSQNILHHVSPHIKIVDDDGDEGAQETHEKFDLFEVHIKNVENLDKNKIVVCNYCLKDFKWSKFRG